MRLIAVWLWLLTLAGFSGLASAGFAQTDADFLRLRKQMVDEVIVGSGITDRRVIQAMLDTPRHEFVSAQVRRQAYRDMALPIGEHQTISSPYIVAFMTESLQPQPEDKVLEIGTGSGYQAAVLSPLVKDVYTIEIVEVLGQRADRTLRRLQYENVHVKIGDGYLGWPEHAPFDKIIVTCSPEKVPQPLVEQLREGGRIVIPVGERYQQTLYVMRKNDGKLEAESLKPTLFVPMTGQAERGRRVQPDPLRPAVINGGFEERAGETGYVPGWYYERQHAIQVGADAPQGQQYLTFHNTEPGDSAHLLQGFAIDGSRVGELGLSAWVKHENVAPGRTRQELPVIAVTFYDQSRKDLGPAWIGPFQGSSPWKKSTKTISVPLAAREGIVRVGLFGATGEISIDDVQIIAKPRK